jgi:UDP-glucuronate 4-epimerase
VKVLVTGVAGFIGYHLARRLVGQGHQVLGIDNLNRYYDVRLKLDRLRELGITATNLESEATVPMDTNDSSLRFLRADIVDQERILGLFADERFDAVCHLAAQAGVRHSLVDPWSYVTNNLHGFLSILEADRAYPVRHLVYASSSSVYGLDRFVPFSETSAADHPASLYAATKRSNELMAHSYSQLFGIPTTGLRFFTVYGPWGRPDMALFVFTRAMLRGDTIDLFNHGDMQRDYTYIDDIVAGVLRVLDHPPQGVAEGTDASRRYRPRPHGYTTSDMAFLSVCRIWSRRWRMNWESKRKRAASRSSLVTSRAPGRIALHCVRRWVSSQPLLSARASSTSLIGTEDITISRLSGSPMAAH